MPSSAVCVGLNYLDTDMAISGSDRDAYNMTQVATAMGVDPEHVTPLTDAYGGDVTKEDVLGALREMVANAQPGDNLMFTFSGTAGKMASEEAGEADGQDEFLQLSNGETISDNELYDILREIPSDVNMTMVFDTPTASAGTITDLDFTGCPGNVLAIAGSLDGQDATFSENGGTFTTTLMEVLQANPGITLGDALNQVNAVTGDTQIANAVCNGDINDFLSQPAFGLKDGIELSTDQSEFEAWQDQIVAASEAREADAGLNALSLEPVVDGQDDCAQDCQDVGHVC
ncbi:hypothetical protein BCR44DRAFT_1457978 [Catenaria anguillulae PL171]|uniref:Peptidase C14 caspase domain-containing protein n=1 Tax=Catenaria anguillulae PL171 TaxID=765915 RepID=A0A1Y2I1I8_9FUNG|nr:hypothetical protein BCR44DRAFT_1457978 [Catenaria anguillulae PL171]